MKLKLLGLIFLLGLFLRLFQLGVVPGGFTPDEASQGYSAYSLLKTGKDEWGLSWPITSFRAFNDFRAPLQTYLIIPSVAVFGLNEFAARFPSAMFGSFAIIFIYFLAKKLFPKSENIGLWAAFFLAISPWNIQFSRMALEANYSSFFFTGGLLFFLCALEKPKYFLLSALLWGLDLYSYLAAKIFLPFFILGLLIFYRDKIFKFKKYLFSFLLILAIFASPLYLDAFFGPGNIRGKDVIITNFSTENLSEISKVQYQSPLNKISPKLSRIFENKFVFSENKFVQNYLSYLSPAFWFAESGRETSYAIIPGRGLFYLWMLPLLIYGFYILIKDNSKTTRIILLWLFLGILPAAITKEGYRPNRAGSLLTLFELVSAYGLLSLMEIKGFFNKLWQELIIGLVIFISLMFYLVDLFYFWPIKFPDSMSYGYRDLISSIKPREDSYRQIIIDKGSESQIFVAFYDSVNPRDFQDASAAWWQEISDKKLLFVDMIDKYKLGKFTFKTFDKSADLSSGNLIVIPAKKMTEDLKPYELDQINYPDQSPAFYLLHYVQK